MAVKFPPALFGIFRNHNDLSLLEAREVLWLLSLEEINPHQNITCKTLTGFIAALVLFPESMIFHYETPAKRYRSFMWSPATQSATVEYRWTYRNEDGDKINEMESNYYSKEKFIQVWSR